LSINFLFCFLLSGDLKFFHAEEKKYSLHIQVSVFLDFILS
jgi:hypothetical protein